MGLGIIGMSLTVREQTRQEWQELGFFYDFDDSARTWVIRGSRTGLRKFCSLLREYAVNPAHFPLSEHEHYGPYSYLKFVTWSEPKIIEDGIYGRTTDFERLCTIVEKAISFSTIGQEVKIDSEYSNDNEATLVVRVEPDDFDVAQADPAISD